MSSLRLLFARVAVLALTVTGTALAGPTAASAAVPNPVVTDPPVAGAHGYPLWDSWFDLGPLGYEEHEYFVSGVAKQDGSLLTAPYTTRIIVTRPSNPARFNGAVMLDWANVTAQFENAVDSAEAHEFLLRSGWAFVHVSAQSAGICCTPLTPKIWDPVRYETLNHPGDAYANDMFSQIAKAVKSPVGLDPLGGLPGARRIIAAGQSQSASKLDTYVRTVQPTAGVIDGFLIHGGGSKTYPAPPPVPVLQLFSDREASPTEPNQTVNYRLWEIAGTAHSDFWIGYHQEVGQGPRFAGGPKQPSTADADLHATAGTYGEVPHPMDATCILAGATFPMRYAVSAALSHLDRWIKDGTPPPMGPRYEFESGALAKDQYQNARGGIRLAPIDVPIASYVSNPCQLGGITIPFTEAQIKLLYPTHADYYAQMQTATAVNVAQGFLLPEDAVDLLARACAAKIRWQELPGPCDSDPIVPEVPLPAAVPLLAAAVLAAVAWHRRRARTD
jgi:hypothetical protein